MKKYFYAVIVLILAIIALAVFWPREVTSGWSRYADSVGGFSFEYPSGEMKPTAEGSFGSTTVRIDNNNGNEIQTPEEGLKMIIATVIPTDPTEVGSVDDWIRVISKRSENSPINDPFPNLRYDLVDGEKIALSDYTNSSTTQAIFFLDNQLYALSIMNLSASDTERVWKSLDFHQE